MRIVPIVALAVLAACQSTPASKPLMTAPATIEQLLLRCQEQTGANFTYTEDIEKQIRECDLGRLKFPPYAPEDSLSVLSIVLVINGFELVRLRPEHLNVWLVRASTAPNPRHDGPIWLPGGPGS